MALVDMVLLGVLQRRLMVCLGAAIVTIITLTQLCPICSSTLLLGIGRQYFLYMHSSDACNHCCDGGLALGNILKSDRDLSFIISVGFGLVLSRKIVSYMVCLVLPRAPMVTIIALTHYLIPHLIQSEN